MNSNVIKQQNNRCLVFCLVFKQNNIPVRMIQLLLFTMRTFPDLDFKISLAIVNEKIKERKSYNERKREKKREKEKERE